MRTRSAVAAFLAGLFLLSGCAGTPGFLNQTPSLQLTASSAAVRAGDSLQISVIPAGGTRLPVRWSVNGIVGGNKDVGTIDASGLYQAPALLPPNPVLEIVAEAGDARASLLLALWNPIPLVDSVTAEPVGDTHRLNVQGRRFVDGAQVTVAGVTFPTSFISSTSLSVRISGSAGTVVEVAVSNPSPGAATSAAVAFLLPRSPRSPRHPSTDATIARLLEQATFGPTAGDTAALHTLIDNSASVDAALAKYIDAQMDPTLTPISVWPNPDPLPANETGFLCLPAVGCLQVLWFQTALQSPDQLRQRTAFALSQMWVISGNTVTVSDAFIGYYEVLSHRAFGNYFQIMDEITRNPAMAFYLNMGNSPRAGAGAIANENYARELLQLFTVGLYMLNDDGTFQLNSNGRRIPVYTEKDVQEFARALTGWTYPRNDNLVGWPQSFHSSITNRRGRMVAAEVHHDAGSKTLLTYPGASFSTLPAGQSAEADLNGALRNIFGHPNVPPFVSKQLIQHLVTSNPSPAYVGRIAAVFRNNGAGVRGDMAAVIKAILLDPEARGGDLAPREDDGHLKEPVLYITGILRRLGFSTAPQRFFSNELGVTMSDVGQGLSQWGRDMGQNVLFAPSVFNYFTPDHAILGGTLLGPEFQLHTTANATIRANFAEEVLRNGFKRWGLDVEGSFTAMAGMAADPVGLTDHLDKIFLRGQMSGSLRRVVIDTISALPGDTLAQRTFRVKMAVYLVVTSSQYSVMR